MRSPAETANLPLDQRGIPHPGSTRRFRGECAREGYRLLHIHDWPLPEMPVVTHVSEAVCTAHHVREMCYVLAGKGERQLGDQRMVVGPGDVYVVRPGEVHGARADPTDPYHFFAIGFDPESLALRPRAAPGRAAGQLGEVGLAMAETSALDDEMRVLDQRVIHGGEGAEHIFHRIISELDRMDSDPRKRALTVIMVQALVVELLVFVTRCSIASRERATGSFRLRTPVRSEFQELLSWMQSHLGDPLSLAEMAQRVGLSPAHFAVAFKREVGQTPLEHLTELRIEEASRRLSEDPTTAITGIALDLGFSSSQYFSLVFRKTKGCTPREWRARNVRLG
ncbi:MAG: helix-turn-helix transcriptional regulator [Planctomycetes bacterium]|nr:helix-turn-helix transcriptional regulator [Planctomycetota bacterium]